MSTTSSLLDVDRVSANEYANFEDLARRLLATEQDTFIFQGEAAVALEAVARGLASPALRAINLVSGPYGATFGRWLSEGGAQVENVAVPFDRAVPPELVAAALDRCPDAGLVSLVHAEAATGAVNDLASIARLAKGAGALVVVDAVASVGAEPLLVDEWELDVTVFSAQKALAGPAGASVVVVSRGAWGALSSRSSPLRGSALSLLDWHDQWLQAGRAVLPVVPGHLETRALGAALERVAAEGLDRVVARHQAAARAVRSSLGALGLEPWVARSEEAAAVATLVKVPAEGGGPRLLEAARGATPGASPAPLAAAPAPLSGQAVRVNHTGREANLGPVLAAVASLAHGQISLGYRPDLAEALRAAADAWSSADVG